MKREITRRDFLRLSAATAVGAVVAACAPPIPTPTPVPSTPTPIPSKYFGNVRLDRRSKLDNCGELWH